MSEPEQQKLFEVISVYFSNTYFGAFYEDAYKFMVDGKFKTIDKAYIYVAESFNRAINQPKNRPDQMDNYTIILKSIVNEYNKYLSRGLTLRDFTILMYKCIIPNYDNSTYSSIYSAAVQSIITNTVSKFTVYVINKTLPKSVSSDFRNSDAQVLRAMNREWKEIFKSMLINEKDEYAQMVIAERNGVSVEKNKTSSEIVEKLESRIRKLVSEKNEIISNRNNLAGYVTALLNEIRETRQKNNELITALSQLQKPIVSQKIIKPQQAAPVITEITPPEQIATPVVSAINTMLEHKYDEVDIIDEEDISNDESEYSDESS